MAMKRDKQDEIAESIEQIFKNTQRIHGKSDALDWIKIASIHSARYVFKRLNLYIPCQTPPQEQESKEPQEAEDMLKTKVIKQNGHYKVQFSIGVQYFTLDYEGDNQSCRWMIRMLESALKTHAEQYYKERLREELISKNKGRKNPIDVNPYDIRDVKRNRK